MITTVQSPLPVPVSPLHKTNLQTNGCTGGEDRIKIEEPSTCTFNTWQKLPFSSLPFCFSFYLFHFSILPTPPNLSTSVLLRIAHRILHLQAYRTTISLNETQYELLNPNIIHTFINGKFSNPSMFHLQKIYALAFPITNNSENLSEPMIESVHHANKYKLSHPDQSQNQKWVGWIVKLDDKHETGRWFY